MDLHLTDDETRALLNLITEAIEDDKFPLSPRVLLLRDILMKFGELGGCRPTSRPSGSGDAARLRHTKRHDVGTLQFSL